MLHRTSLPDCVVNCKKTEKCCLFFSGVAALLLNLVALSPVFHLMITKAEFLTRLTALTLLGHLVLPEKSLFICLQRWIQRGRQQMAPASEVCLCHVPLNDGVWYL